MLDVDKWFGVGRRSRLPECFDAGEILLAVTVVSELRCLLMHERVVRLRHAAPYIVRQRSQERRTIRLAQVSSGGSEGVEMLASPGCP